MTTKPCIHGKKPAQPHGRKAPPLTLCGLRGSHHTMGFSAGHVTCQRCRRVILQALRAEVRA